MANGPERVFGVDFSGAQDAETNVWIAGGPLSAEGLRIDTLGPAAEVLDDPTGRVETHRGLVSWLRCQENTAVGLDFSFGLPAFLAEEMAAADWPAFLDAFPPAGCDDADSFEDWGKARTRDHTDGDRTFCKRKTDRPVGASSPYGFIGSTITYYGVRDVLKPVVRGSDGGQAVATVAPMQTTTFDPALTLLETYPAGTLDRLGLSRQNYKGGSDAERKRRERNLDGLVADAGVDIGDDGRETVIENTGGDALDAVVAAVATRRAVEGEFAVADDRYDEREGYIYV
jgi:hypothetical protein